MDLKTATPAKEHSPADTDATRAPRGAGLLSFVFLLPRRAAVVLLRGYKMLISPLLPNACRFQPTCSEYAAEAIRKGGLVRGSLRTLWRLARCHPFCKGGYDPP
jgi:putative membrane protein insertion efficiency factor